MTTLEEIRYAYVWQSCVGVESRAKEFDGWLRIMRYESWDDGYASGNSDARGRTKTPYANPYRET